jgi:hypothetical protein
MSAMTNWIEFSVLYFLTKMILFKVSMVFVQSVHKLYILNPATLLGCITSYLNYAVQSGLKQSNESTIDQLFSEWKVFLYFGFTKIPVTGHTCRDYTVLDLLSFPEF